VLLLIDDTCGSVIGGKLLQAAEFVLGHAFSCVFGRFLKRNCFVFHVFMLHGPGVWVHFDADLLEKYGNF
jgi:hypothetical protein